jgi:outer membrane immunogenic protein
VQRAYGGGTLMRRSAIGIGLVLSLCSTASANAYERPFAWTGLYVGLNAGYSWGKATADVDVTTSERTRVFRAFGQPGQTLVSDVTVAGPSGSGSRSGDVNGWLGGGHIGYNWQSQRWVYGVETDIQWTGQDGDITACLGPDCAKASYQLDWFGTLRGRVGYLLEPRSLIYLTGGLAYGHLSADFSASGPSIPDVSVSDSATRAGWVVGGGFEWAFDRTWSLRAEYLYLDLGTMRTKLGSISGAQTISPNTPQEGFTTVIDQSGNGTVHTQFTDQIFRLAVSYKFGDSYAPLK